MVNHGNQEQHRKTNLLNRYILAVVPASDYSEAVVDVVSLCIVGSVDLVL